MCEETRGSNRRASCEGEDVHDVFGTWFWQRCAKEEASVALLDFLGDAAKENLPLNAVERSGSSALRAGPSSFTPLILTATVC